MTPPASRRLAAILAADIAGYSALVSADEEGTVRALKGHQAAVLPLVGQHGGRVIDTAGDGIMAEFGSVLAALNCALAIQAAMTERNADVPTGKRLQYRIGINLGDVIFDEARIFGDGINIAARLEGLAEPGGICVAATVYEHSNGKVACSFEDLGEQALKNIARPVRVYRVKPPRAPAIAMPAPASALGSLSLPDKPSIAVLPFTNMSGDKEQEYLADGIVEDVLTALSQVSSLFVVARNSSFAFKGKNPDIRDVGRQLGVRYVLEGSTRSSAGRLRVTAQLIDATIGTHVWAERYDRRLDDIFQIQDELTKEIVTALRIKLTDGEQASIWLRSTSNVEAWGYATRGEDLIWRGTAADMAQGRALLEQAVACDPKYAKALALIAQSHNFDARFYYTPSQEVSAKLAAEYVAKAKSVDPEEPYAIWAGANVHALEGRYEDAVRDMEQLVSRHPSHAMYWLGYGRLMIDVGRAEDAERGLRHAIRLNPFCPINYLLVLGGALERQGRTGEAVELYNEAIRRQPNSLPGHLHVAVLSVASGNMHAARAHIAEILRINPKYRVAAAVPFCLYADKAAKQAFLDALRAAGLPE